MKDVCAVGARTVLGFSGMYGVRWLIRVQQYGRLGLQASASR